MMVEGETPNAHVGHLLRQLREERGISIRELSRMSGLSANALSMIERGLSSPSVSTLYRLTDALNTPITALFQQMGDREPIVFRSSSERKRIPFPQGMWEGLGGESFSGRTQPFMLTLEAGAESGKEAIVHTGNEFVICLDGKLEYEVEGNIYSMEAGDSLLFAARLAHRWRNAGDDVTHAVFVLSGFDEYEQPGMFHYTI
jgi:transcriptional regulator with XRE-family HTH domain